ncbi:MAG: TolC family protein [Bacteroidota bacterium]
MKSFHLFIVFLSSFTLAGGGTYSQGLQPIGTIASPVTPDKGTKAAPAALVITLKECLKRSVANSPRLKIAGLEHLRLQYNYKASVGIGLPQVRLTGSYDDYLRLPTQMIPNIFSSPPNPSEMIPVQFGTSFNISGAVEASQVIFDQSWLSGLRMARQVMQQNELATEKSRIEVVYEVAQTYYLTQIARQQIRNMESNLEKIEKAEKIAQSQYENGIIRRIDLDRIAVQKNNMITGIDRLSVTYLQNLDLQKYYMGLDPAEEIVPEDSISTAIVTPGTTGDAASHIDIRMIGMQKEVLTASVRMERASYFPSIVLIGSLNYLNQSNTMYLFGKPTDWFNTSLVGIRLSVPLFSGMQNHYKVCQTKIEIEKLKVTEDDTRLLLRINSEDAARKLLNSAEAEKRQRENMALGERVYNISQEQYQKGMIPLTDLLNAETALSDAQANHVYALVQMKISELNYLKANGLLLQIVE